MPFSIRAEDADAEGEDADDGDRESRSLDEPAYRVAKLLQEIHAAPKKPIGPLMYREKDGIRYFYDKAGHEVGSMSIETHEKIRKITEGRK